MKRLGGWVFCAIVLCALIFPPRLACAQEVPLDGFFPLLGMGLSDEFIFDDLLGQSPVASSGVSGNLLGAGSVPYYDVALLDTGAGLSLVTDAAFDAFGLGESGQGGGSDGYRGTETVPLGGTGLINAVINDPLGLYASGLQDRTSAGAALAMSNSALEGQTNTSMLTFPQESDLPNVVGLPFASQYATQIRNDQPQVFELNGKTVRSPAIDFLPLGSGGGDISRKAALSLDPGAAFTTAPGYFQNILNIVNEIPVHENPQLPTGLGGGIATGGLFLDVFASNQGNNLGSSSSPSRFFFDTGASVTVMSEPTAAALGFDVVTDTPEFTISILGSGGEIEDVPGFYLDEITLPALGGSITANNVPVVVLDVVDVSDPGNVVPGIVGTNLLAGRNVVIDPNPSIGAGGESAGLYISDPVTNDFTWATSASVTAWSTEAAWDASATPDLLSVAWLTPQGALDQEAAVSGDQQAWSVDVAGGQSGQSMLVSIAPNSSLTTFSGTTVRQGGALLINDGTLDTQYVDLRGGLLTGDGVVNTGSGPIEGQVEVVGGTIAPGVGANIGTLAIDGRLSLLGSSTLEFDLQGDLAGFSHDQLIIEGDAALAGTLEVFLDEQAFNPSVGETYVLLTYEEAAGQFDKTLLPDGYFWEVRYEADQVVLEILGQGVKGDFNHDGTVDAADYTLWRDNLGAYYSQNEFSDWLTNYGTSVAVPAAAVPEPSSIFFIGLAVGYASSWRLAPRRDLPQAAQ